jgi:hypothetical protein
MMEAQSSSKTSVPTRGARYNIPEGAILQKLTMFAADIKKIYRQGRRILGLPQRNRSEECRRQYLILTLYISLILHQFLFLYLHT